MAGEKRSRRVEVRYDLDAFCLCAWGSHREPIKRSTDLSACWG